MANYNRRVGRQTVGCDEERIPGGATEEVRVEDGPVFFVSADEKVFVGRVSPVDANSHGAASSGVCTHAVAIRAPTSIGQRRRLPQEKKKLLTGRRPMRNWTQLILFFYLFHLFHRQSMMQMETPYDIKLVFAQKINKNCCHQSRTF